MEDQANTRSRDLRGILTDEARTAASCCTTQEQEACCAPAEKAGCCGPVPAAGGGCGCQ